MDCKIRLKLGEIEVEYEGSEEYMREGFMDLLAEVVNTFADVRPHIAVNGAPSSNGDGHGKEEAEASGAIDLSTSTIASRIGASSGADLILAAAAHLSLVRNKASFSRNDIREEMKNATAYYTQSIGSNLGQSLTSLVKKGKLNQRSDNNFALSNGALAELRSKLAS